MSKWRNPFRARGEPEKRGLGRNKEEKVDKRLRGRMVRRTFVMVFQWQINANEWVGSCRVVIRKLPTEEDAAWPNVCVTRN